MPRVERYIRWIGIPVVAFLPYFLVDHSDHHGFTFWENYGISVVFTAVFWNGAFLIFLLYRLKFPKISQTARRLTLIILTMILFILVTTPIIKLVLGLSTWESLKDLSDLFAFLPVTILISVFIGSIYEGAFFFDKWKKTIRINEELKNQQIRTQLEVLQNQMSPHFLFNSLNALTTLIAEDQETAIEFTQKLSEVYRYILQNKQRELVLLSEELEFAGSYVYLLQMRYPKNLKVEFKISDHARDQFIAPMTLQMLIENAIKHNVISYTDPLGITIMTDAENQIIVENNFQPKSIVQKGTKTGLANIRNRYSFFGNKEIVVSNSKDYFTVKVPLINLIRETDYVSVNHG